jgi:hypothetical protein
MANNSGNLLPAFIKIFFGYPTLCDSLLLLYQFQVKTSEFLTINLAAKE